MNEYISLIVILAIYVASVIPAYQHGRINGYKRGYEDGRHAEAISNTLRNVP